MKNGLYRDSAVLAYPLHHGAPLAGEDRRQPPANCRRWHSPGPAAVLRAKRSRDDLYCEESGAASKLSNSLNVIFAIAAGDISLTQSTCTPFRAEHAASELAIARSRYVLHTYTA
jgi:hypothetical protein